jgi:formamidopyrimidine-DNA glycosylase
LPDRSTRVEFVIASEATQSRQKRLDYPIKSGNDAKSKLFFNDQRKFGWIKLLPTIEVENIDFLKKVGPEPLSGDPKLGQVFLSNIRRRNGTTIKSAILDQTVIAGIGNIYADESLWAARVHPATRVRDLPDAKLLEILKCAIEVMTKSIASGGSTMKNYIRADGSKGDYLEKFANVFRREGLNCPRCGTKIIKTRVAGRGTHLCPKCQKPPPIDKNA